MCRTRIKIKIKKKKHNLDILKHLYSKKKEEKGKKERYHINSGRVLFEYSRADEI